MKKTLNRNKDISMAVTAETLASMLDCGRATAVRIGTDAGAKIQVGWRTLYKVSKVDKFLEAITE